MSTETMSTAHRCGQVEKMNQRMKLGLGGGFRGGSKDGNPQGKAVPVPWYNTNLPPSVPPSPLRPSLPLFSAAASLPGTSDEQAEEGKEGKERWEGRKGSESCRRDTCEGAKDERRAEGEFCTAVAHGSSPLNPETLPPDPHARPSAPHPPLLPSLPPFHPPSLPLMAG